ncbi:MAG: PAS domain-containing protein [Armatimonadetes bacterium]|nr:PAS domain-containing protein [Armatimonadota bacterium]
MHEERETLAAVLGLPSELPAWEQLPFGCRWLGPDGRILWANQVELQALGYPLPELRGRHVDRLQADGARLGEQLAAASPERPIRNFPSVLRRADGSRWHVLLDIDPVYQQGQLQGYRWLTRDNSGEAETVRALRESQDHLELALEAAAMGTWEWDMRSGRVTWSDNLEPLHGLPPGGFGGTIEAYQELIHPDDRRILAAAIERALATDDRFSTEVRVVWPNGEIHWCAGRGRVFRDASGQPQRVVGIGLDITRRKEAEIALEQARELLEERVAQRTEQLQEMADELARSNTELQQFAYLASHDLQEPLRMVVSYLQLLARRCNGQLDEDCRDYLEFAVDGAQRMQGLIRGLLDYSRVDTRGRTFQDVESAEALALALRNLQPCLEEAGAAVTAGALPVVHGDLSQLVQLFQNLIGNATKFRGERPPAIEITAERRAGDWLFRVRDNGLGVPAESREVIFQIFARLQHRSQYPGTGIGLAVCRKVVERHGGAIWVEPNPTGGSIFAFTLPAVGPGEGHS